MVGFSFFFWTSWVYVTLLGSLYRGVMHVSAEHHAAEDPLSHIERRVYLTQNVAATSVLWKTVTVVYTPKPIAPGSNWMYPQVNATEMKAAPACNNPDFRSELRLNTTLCQTQLCVRAKKWGDRNYTFFEIPDLPYVGTKEFPKHQEQHWMNLYASGIRYTFSSNPFQYPLEEACFGFKGLPQASNTYKVYIADYFGKVCTEVLTFPTSVTLTCSPA
ncbi:hypothetical protein HMI54_001836 [Coelomomyces lativittatus]|nr:hypothetical protein HMI54_001836 [Coelomomyces lativittatus]KAJ1512020.1 hypothetical protein HMI56_004630 [Coelomomyces lativittatus]KAJ1516125.1 hypothetical protein HMI55_002925 [Coelomomyces lativittatus]